MECNQAATPLLWTVVILVCLAGKGQADFTPAAVADLTCPSDFFVIEGACMKVFRAANSHKVSHMEVCAKRQARLAIIDSQVKNDWVRQELNYLMVERATMDMQKRNSRAYRINRRSTGFLAKQWLNFASGQQYAYYRHFAIEAKDGKWVEASRVKPAFAVVCEVPATYPSDWCKARSYTDGHIKLIQGVCLKVEHYYGKYDDVNNARYYWKGVEKLKKQGYVMARIDTPEKNEAARSLLLLEKTTYKPQRFNGFFDYQWKFTKPIWPHMEKQTFTNWAPGEPSDDSRRCVEMQRADGKWLSQHCDKEQRLSIGQIKRRPRCFTPTHTLHASIRVLDAYHKIQVTCHPGTIRSGRKGDLECVNTRYGDMFPHVSCVPIAGKSYSRYTNKAACKDRFLAFPSGVTPHTSIPTFEYANATCRRANMEVPSHDHIGCVQAFIRNVRDMPEYKFFATSTTGPWIYLQNEKTPYKYFDRDGNTRGYTSVTERNYKNSVVCVDVPKSTENTTSSGVVGTTSPPSVVKLTNIAYRCLGKVFQYSNKTKGDSFQDAQQSCRKGNMTLPDGSLLSCLQALVKYVQTNPQYVSFVTDNYGPWIHRPIYAYTPYRWMDLNGKTRGYNASTAKHANNRAVCVRDATPADGPGGDTSAAAASGVPAIAGGIGSVAVIVLFLAGYLYRKSLASSFQNFSARFERTDESDGNGVGRIPDLQRSTSEVSQTDLISARGSAHEITYGNSGADAIYSNPVAE